MPRKQTSEFESYEGKRKTEKHLRITRSMIDSEAWREMGAHEFAVYVMLKHVFFKKTEHGATINENSKRLIITYNEAQDCLKMSRARFKKAVDNLERVGLIDVIQRSRNMRHANIYGLSDRWHDYKAEGQPCRKWPMRRAKERPEVEGEESREYIRLDY